MKTYKIPVVWQMYGVVRVEADSLEQAMELALEAKLPDGDYIEGSFELDNEEIIKEMNNE